MKHLFLVSIGPVQEFIASARRTRDLHFGSWLLSELSRAAAYTIDNQNKGSLIFPAPEKTEWLQSRQPFTVANRILAIIEQEPGALAALVQAAVTRRLYEIRDQAYKSISLFGEPQTVAYKQIDDLVELVWVALPYHENNYHEVRRQLEMLMAARKNTYAFGPVQWGDDVPKSSLDGQLESVIPENEYPPRNATTSERQHILQRLYNRYGIAGLGERLSGVDLLKRSGSTAFDSHFPSTSHIAVGPFLKRMQGIDDTGKQKLRTAWNGYVKKLESLAIFPLERSVPSHHPILGCYDGVLLLESRLADVLGIPSTDTTQSENVLQAKSALQSFYAVLDEQFKAAGLSKARPSTYYALLQADGDSMGELIDALAERGYEQHRNFSLALSRFAESVRTIVEKDHQGALVYSGGDDVLAFLPLHTVLQCAIQLKTRLYEELNGLATQLKRRPPTLSVGIAIVHHLDSLREARRLAHNAEQQAKREDGKNALAITVSKRSGEDYRVVGTWGKIDVRLFRLITYCRAASIPVGMAYELRDLVLRLSVPKSDPQYETLQNVIQLDTLRILLRKLTIPASKLPPKQVDEIEAFLRVQLGLPPKEQKGEQGAPQVTTLTEKKGEQGMAQVSIERFINELVIAQMLAEAELLAARDGGKL